MAPAADDGGACRPCGTRMRACCPAPDAFAACRSAVQQCVDGVCLRCGPARTLDPGCPGCAPAWTPPLWTHTRVSVLVKLRIRQVNPDLVHFTFSRIAVATTPKLTMSGDQLGGGVPGPVHRGVSPDRARQPDPGAQI